MSRSLVLAVFACLLLSGCTVSLSTIRGDYDLLREEIHRAKSQGGMHCAPLPLAEAQLQYRFASLELGQGDFDRAGQHLRAGRGAAAAALSGTADCPVTGVSTKDLGSDPWADADGDGIGDRTDLCPYEIEDRDGFSDNDGCWEPDNDLDGVADADDQCPLEAEDIDGTEDEDGCPEEDDDGDGVADFEDECPSEAEVFNGFQDGDGCPDLVPMYVEVRGDSVGFVEPITFLPGGSDLLGTSRRAVEELATLLKSSPGVNLRVVGHTSNRGDAAELVELSLRRARSVVDFLVAEGVASERLEAVGKGGDAPLTTNRTAQGRKANERVDVELTSGRFEGFE